MSSVFSHFKFMRGYAAFFLFTHYFDFSGQTRGRPSRKITEGLAWYGNTCLVYDTYGGGGGISNLLPPRPSGNTKKTPPLPPAYLRWVGGEREFQIFFPSQHDHSLDRYGFVIFCDAKFCLWCRYATRDPHSSQRFILSSAQ